MYFDHNKQLRPKFVLKAFLSLSLLTACSLGAVVPSSQKLPEMEIQVGEKRVTAEIANTNLSRQIGLMHRRNLKEDHGMLFVFQRNETQCMWMKNTLIDLDVAFANESGNILNIEQMKAGTLDIHCSRGNAKIALEMNSDWFNQKGLSIGDLIKVPALALEIN
jgi:uncharacterized membrane protein (UPF0127 family)